MLTSASSSLQTVREWVEMPERSSIFAATGAGVAEFKSDRTFALVTTDLNPMSAIARQPGGSAVGAVGALVERWNGQAFVAVPKHRPPPAGGAVSSSPLDLVIAGDGTWVILYGDGFLSVLSSAGVYLGGFDSSTGVPPGAQRLLLASEKRILIGGAHGLAVLAR
jgi:hypothetical protein